MIQVRTMFPIAVDSDDHKYPEGVYYDNNVNPGFVHYLEQWYQGRKIKFLDLGCAGGGLVTHLADTDHNAVGLEGSDHCLNVRPEMITEVGFLPAGYKNWEKYGNKRLFTCDITKEYDIVEDGVPMQFDLITCWDVMEHFQQYEVDNFLRLVHKHLSPNGFFVASIALFDAGRHAESANTPEGLNYHKSVYPREWWLERTDKYFNSVGYPFSITNRDYIIDNPAYLLFTGTKK